MDTSNTTETAEKPNIGATVTAEENVNPDCTEETIDDKTSPASGDNSSVPRNPGVEVAQITSQLMRDPKTMAAFQEQLDTMIGKSSGYIESLPKAVQRRLKALKRLQSEIFVVQSKFYEEVHALEQKYESKYAPLFQQREAIINARVEPTDEQCQWEEEEEEEGGEGEDKPAKVVQVDETKSNAEHRRTEPEEEEEKTAGVPEFWLTIFKNVDSLSSLVQENDEEVLKNLLDIKVKFSYPETMGFTLEFVFAPNEYFTNTVLTKEYVMRTNPDPDHPLQFEGPEIVQCKGCSIDWTADKNLTVRKQKQRSSSSGSKAFVTKFVRVESFFNFFSPPEAKEDDEDDTNRELLLADYEIGQLLQDRIIPRAVLYFTGEALEGAEEDEDEDDESEAEGEGENEDEGADYDEDADEDYVPPKGSENSPASCRQQ